MIATLDDTETAQVSVNGIERPDGPVSQAELGRVLAKVADESGGAVRVEVREPDGSRYADILQPRPRPTAGTEEQAPPVEAPMLTGGGFLPGEAVLVAVVTATINAGPDGTASLTGLPLAAKPGGEAILFGSSSGTTVRGSLAGRPAISRRRWWRR
ncbi:MAG: hypothetical protein M0004_16560 [Actinomycetota bacterium]|nr:hypothetical protein [Actinomycetota bacterium]